jgi:type IV pilus assembly protein PilX
MANISQNRFPRSQRGAVLITGIILMLVLTMLVLAMIRSGTVEERMARNARDQQSAMQSAEAVLREAETVIVSGTPFDPFVQASFDSACTNGMCYKPAAANTWDKIDWDSTTATATFQDEASRLGGLTKQPRYVIEVMIAPTRATSAAQCDDGLAKITSRGAGNGGSIVYLQSIVRFRVFTNNC